MGLADFVVMSTPGTVHFISSWTAADPLPCCLTCYVFAGMQSTLKTGDVDCLVDWLIGWFVAWLFD
jgi:hypothetical protein